MKYSDLTPREQEIWDEIAKGLSYKQIAFNLGLSLHTIKNKASIISRKIGTHNNASLAIMHPRYDKCRANDW